MSNNNYSQAYLKKINGILNALFNYACKHDDFLLKLIKRNLHLFDQ